MSNSRSIYCGELYDQVYALDNYYVIDNKTNNSIKKCVIYFSSSGLYFPNDIEHFKEAFIDNDSTYEWQRHRIKNIDREIFVRDITKEFYTRGISKDINTIDKILVLLRGLTDGYELTTVGSSAGGYMAILAGCLLDAKRIFAFSSYHDLYLIDHESWPLTYELENDSNVSKWYRLRTFIEQAENTIIYYLYPSKLEGDFEQSRAILGCKNVYEYAFDSDIHGIPWNQAKGKSPTLAIFMGKCDESRIALAKKYSGRIISQLKWNFDVLLS